MLNLEERLDRVASGGSGPKEVPILGVDEVCHINVFLALPPANGAFSFGLSFTTGTSEHRMVCLVSPRFEPV